MVNTADIFEKSGNVKVSQFIDDLTVSTISHYLEYKIRRGEWVEEKEWDQSKYGYYADPLIEVLLERCRDEVGEIIGKELLSTYSYARVYQPGEQLTPHIDRESCEISVTVNVAYKGPPSPIYMEYADNSPQKHILNNGDAIIYKGCEAMHWRQPLHNDQLVVQFMLHYVDKNGPNAEFARDKRSCIAEPKGRYE